MKNLMRVLCLVLVLAALLCGCDAKDLKETPEKGTESQVVTEPAETACTTEAELRAALVAGGRVTIGADLQLTSEVVVAGTILDGGGYTITGPAYDEEDPTTENAITVTGGTVENVTVKGAYRGIGDNKGSGANGDVRLKNVTVDSDTYVLNFGCGNGQSGLYVENSTLQGWTSYTKFREAVFTNCTFRWNESGGNGNLRPYINTTLVGCKFEGKTEADGTVTPFNLSFKSGSDGILLTLENCYVGETLITQENINDLLAVKAYGNIVQVHNTAS